MLLLSLPTSVVLPQNSCDDQDYEIQDQKRFLLWAYGTNHDFSFHGNNRGQFMANLMVKPAEPANLEEYDKISLTMPNVEGKYFEIFIVPATS